MAEIRFCRYCNFAFFALWVYNFMMCLVLGCQTISSIIVLLFGPLVGTPEFLYLSYYGVYMFWPPPGLCLGKLLPDLDMLFATSMSFCVCSRGGGGSTNMWWVGVLLMFLVILRVTSLCVVTSLISFWGFGCPVSCVRALLFFWVAQ